MNLSVKYLIFIEDTTLGTPKCTVIMKITYLIINTPEVTHSFRKYTTAHLVSVLHRVLAFVLIPNEMNMALGV